MIEIFNNITSQKEFLWATQIFLIIFATLLTSFVVGKIITKVEKRLSANKNIWDDLILRASRKPVKAMIWILGAVFAIKTTDHYTSANLYGVASSLQNLAIIYCVSWFAWKLIKGYEVRLIKKRKKEEKDVTVISAIMKLLKAAMLVTAALMVLQTLGVSIGGILAFGGVGGIAIGFAAKDLLANFFGAFMIYLDRPFSVGDWIRSPDKEIEGSVESIGWRSTIIMTFEKRRLYVPNSIFNTIVIENPSRMSHRRINEIIGVRYDDIKNIDQITKEIRAMLANHKEIDDSESLTVSLESFGDFSVNIAVKAYSYVTRGSEFFPIKQEILLKINEIIEKNNSEIAFPTSVLSIEKPIQISGGSTL